LAKRRSKQIQPTSGPEKAFGQALRIFREGRKLSQEQLGFDAGFDRTYISLLERGIQSPTLRTLFRLSEILQVSPTKIVSRTEALIRNQRKETQKP
jgi:transcriptional regulator with XRE-family HTH domain